MTRGLSNLTKEAEDAELFALSKSKTSEAGEAVKPFDPARQIARKRSHEMTQVVEAGKKGFSYQFNYLFNERFQLRIVRSS